MKSRKKQVIIYSILSILFLWLNVPLVSYGQNTPQMIPPATVTPKVTAIISPDEISIKQKEMLNTNVRVDNHSGSGSGTIIDCIESEEDKLFEIRVLTNAHVTRQRLINKMHVDSITGRVTRQTIDMGCRIIVFNHIDGTEKVYVAKIVKENIFLDLAILSFFSKEKLAVARIASNELLSSVRVFNEVFAIGCQLGKVPIPTYGIISRIITYRKNNEEANSYMHTAHIAGGSSGGGLFIEHNGHYYLIGIPFRIESNSYQLYPHLAESISISVAWPLIDETSISQ